VPVIATSVGGLRWLVEDGETGLVVAPGDAPALRAAIERLRDDITLRETLGSRARARARERFEWSTITTQLLRAYETACRS
jgi:glycosyltransferase involved in cell wall biosynthesis